MYPTEDKDVNLNVIDQFIKILKVEIGYSHHCLGDLPLLTAFIKGAKILEFHFTDSRKGKTFRDHLISLTKEEVKNLILKFRRVKDLLGTDKKFPLRSEIKAGHIKVLGEEFILIKMSVKVKL